MSNAAQDHLLELYQEWRKHTEAEREAISEGNWRHVKNCQKAKGELQARILKQTEEAQEEWLRLGIDRKAMEKELRSVVNELIYLENVNAQAVAELRKAGGEELETLTRSRKTLSKIQKHYATEAPVSWESYS
jgi:hypothetical protein